MTYQQGTACVQNFHLHNWRRGHQSIYQKFSWILGSQLFQLMMQNLNKFSFFLNVFLFAKKRIKMQKKVYSQLFQLMIQNLNNSTLCFRGPILSHNCMIITRSFLVQSNQCLYIKVLRFQKIILIWKRKKRKKKLKYGFFSVHFSLSLDLKLI